MCRAVVSGSNALLLNVVNGAVAVTVTTLGTHIAPCRCPTMIPPAASLRLLRATMGFLRRQRLYSFHPLKNSAQSQMQLRDFLATFEEYKPLLADQWNSIGAFILRPSMEECLCKLVRACYTRREQPPERRQMASAGWPPVVMACVLELRPHFQDIIGRWDVPEICDDRPIGPRGKGKFGHTQDDGTHVEQEIDRPARPYTLQPDEVQRLAWIEGTFRAAVSKTRRNGLDEQREALMRNAPSEAEMKTIMDSAFRRIDAINAALATPTRKAPSPATVAGPPARPLGTEA